MSSSMRGTDLKYGTEMKKSEEAVANGATADAAARLTISRVTQSVTPNPFIHTHRCTHIQGGGGGGTVAAGITG